MLTSLGFARFSRTTLNTPVIMTWMLVSSLFLIGFAAVAQDGDAVYGVDISGAGQGFRTAALDGMRQGLSLTRDHDDAAAEASAAEEEALRSQHPAMDFSHDPISPGDEVRVTMLEDPKVHFEGTVSVSGTVPIPFLGEFRIVGMTEAEASEALEAELTHRLYQYATVSVSLLARGPGQVYIYGAVRNPGGVPLPRYSNLTILRLVLASGGLTGWAAPEETFIMRYGTAGGQVERINVNMSEIFATALPNSERDVVLRDGDIVCVPGLNGELFQFMSAEDREVIVVGEVGRPGIIHFGPGELRTVMRAIFKAGGFREFARRDAVRIIRYERDQSRAELIVNAAEIMEKGYLHKDIEVHPGDMLIVPQRRVNF